MIISWFYLNYSTRRVRPLGQQWLDRGKYYCCPSQCSPTHVGPLVFKEQAMKDNSIKKRGRILRVKKGYNPNSSSIGSGILPFLAFAAGAGVLTIILSNTLESANKIIKKRAAAVPKDSGESEPGKVD